jgi:HD-GYP domain-containing protein (c-di-GMP phosphodiesterase class II)
LIAATLLLQAAVIGLGGLALVQMLRNGVSQRVQDQGRDQLAHEAERFASEVARIVKEPIKLGTDGWRKAQDLVEARKLTGGAAIFVLDERARVVCHPALRRNPNMRRIDYSEQQIQIEPSGETWQLGNFSSRAVLTGSAQMLSGEVAIAACYDPERKIRVVVYQPVEGLLAAGDRATQGLLSWGGVAALMVLAISAGGSIMLMRRYDSALSRANEHLEREVQRRTDVGLTIRNSLIFGLAKLADYRDTDTGRHLERICRYCELIAIEIRPLFQEIDEGWIDRLKLSSSMHDIGKVGIADSVLLKPGGLNDFERVQMQRHVMIGAETLTAIQERVGNDELLSMAIDVTMQHHEKFDGSGYPAGLAGEAISLPARIVALADVYDALTSSRVYKKAMSHEEARRIILASRGTHFDPIIVDAFDRRSREFAMVCEQLQTVDGERCSVTQLSRAVMLRAA